MYEKCIVFAGRRGLEQGPVRESVARIPEVSKKIKEAQKVLETQGLKQPAVDLFNVLQTWRNDDSISADLQFLVAAIVQLGLFDRYTRNQGESQFIVGNTTGVSPAKVAAGKTTFETMILESEYCRKSSPIYEQQPSIDSAPPSYVLVGPSLEEFGIFGLDLDSEFVKLPWEQKDLYQILSQLNLDQQVDQFIHIGPCYAHCAEEMSNRKIFEFSLGNSIEMDPLLNSFWKTA